MTDQEKASLTLEFLADNQDYIVDDLRGTFEFPIRRCLEYSGPYRRKMQGNLYSSMLLHLRKLVQERIPEVTIETVYILMDDEKIGTLVGDMIWRAIDGDDRTGA